MIGVPGALLGTARADTHADLEQAVDDVVVGMGGSRQDRAVTAQTSAQS